MNKNYPTGTESLNKNFPTGTVPVNKNYPTGTVPVNKNFPTGTVSVNKNYPTGTVPVNNHFLILFHGSSSIWQVQQEGTGKDSTLGSSVSTSKAARLCTIVS